MFKWIFGLLLGCCSLFVLPTIPPTTILVISIISAIGFAWYSKVSQNILVIGFAVFLSGFSLGFFWASLNAAKQIDNQIDPPHNQSAHIIEAEIDTLPVIYPDYCRFQIIVTNSSVKSLIGKTLSLKDYSKQCPYKLGQSWTLTVKLKPIYGPVNQSAFDYEFYLFQSGIDGRGYIKGSQFKSSARALSVASLRQGIYTKLNHFEQAGIFQALILGEKGNMSFAQRQKLREFGLSHLVAISGLHISIIAGVSFWLMFKLAGLCNILFPRLYWKPLNIALVASCIVALLYSALADFSLPTVRALVMWCSVVFCRLLKREAAFLLGLKVALLVILLFDPLSVLSAGFWMSFIAVTVISLLLFGRVGHDSSATSKLKTLVKLQIAITLILMIPSLLLFQESSALGLLANLIMIPAFSLVVLPITLVAVVLLVLFNNLWLMSLLNEVYSHFFNALTNVTPYTEWAQVSLFYEPWLLIVLLLLAFSSCFPLGKLKVPLGSMIVVILLASSLASDPHEHEAELVVFDVGHGLAALLTDGENHVLYDTGYASNNFSAFESYVYPSLQRKGIKHLDALVLSHKDNDHSGGAKTILEKLSVDKVYAGRWLQDNHSIVGYEPCSSGTQEKIGNFLLEFLHPEVSTKGGNNDSCVMKVTGLGENSDFSILFTGDIEKKTEYHLAEKLEHKLSADILVAPHHGSKSSSSYPLLKMVDPQMVIFPTERHSRYRLPNKEVVQRYQLFETKLLDTGCLGQIFIWLDSRDYQFQRQERRLWRQSACSLTEN